MQWHLRDHTCDRDHGRFSVGPSQVQVGASKAWVRNHGRLNHFLGPGFRASIDAKDEGQGEAEAEKNGRDDGRSNNASGAI